jgi:hypothetical protein
MKVSVFNPEDGRSMTLLEIGKLPPDYKASYPKTQ